MSSSRPAIIRVTRNGAVLPDPGARQSLKTRLERDHVLHLPGFLEPELIADSMSKLQTARFEEISIDGYYRRLELRDPLNQRLSFLISDRGLLDLVGFLFDAPASIAGFHGVGYRMLPGKGHFLDWHGDHLVPNRVAALSVNLSPERYEGGLFQIRSHPKTSPDFVG